MATGSVAILVPTQAVVDEATGTGDIIAAVADNHIIVYGFILTADGATNVHFETDATTDLTGPMKFFNNAQGPLQIMSSDHRLGLFQTDVGEKLNLVSSNSVQVSGFVVYRLHNP